MTFAASSVAASPILDAEWILGQLPAAIRADVVWAAKPIREGLAKLRSGSPDEERLGRVTDEVLEPLWRLSEAWARAWREDPENLERASEAELERQHARLRAFLDDEEGVDTVDWAFELLRRLSATAAARLRERVDVELELDLEQLRGDRGFVALSRGMIALTAAAEEAREGTDRTLAADLVDLAFLQLNKMAEELADELEPFADEPREQRMQRFVRSVERLRSGLTEAEYATLVGAQLRDFDDAPRY